MRAEVVEGYVLLDGELPDAVAKAIVKALHESTLLNIENLVESAGDMEAKGVHIVILCSGLDLFPSEPTLVAESELEFVAVLTCLLGAKDGHDLGQLDLTDAFEGIVDLLLLVLELVLIGEALPFAATADAVVFTERNVALLRILIKPHSLSLGIAVFLALDLEIDNVAGNDKGYKNYQVIDTRKGLTLGCNACNLNPLEQRQLFLFSCHYNRNINSIEQKQGHPTRVQTPASYIIIYKDRAKITIKAIFNRRT